MSALRRLAEGRTTFLVTHDLSLAAKSDLILYLDHGRIVEQGTHEELLHLDRWYAALYGLQTDTRKVGRKEVQHAHAR